MKIKNKKVKVLLVILLLIGIVAITFGITYAFLTYIKEGTKENTITTGTITFHYDESIAKGISISDAVPVISNDDAKSSNKYYDFRITSKTTPADVPYYITARLSDDSDSVLGDIVDIYLTEVDGSSESVTDLFKDSIVNYNSLDQYDDVSDYTEKVIYQSTVTKGTTNYDKTFRLRLWIDQFANYSGVEVTKYYCDEELVDEDDYNNCSGNKSTNVVMEYPYNDMSFSIKLNVYAEGADGSENQIPSSTVGYTNSHNSNVKTIADALDDLNDIFN